MWKPINGYEHYSIDDTGNIKTKSGIILKHRKNQQGVIFTQISKNGNRRNVTISKLIKENFDIKEIIKRDSEFATYPPQLFISNMNPPKKQNYSIDEVIFHLEIKARKID